MRREEVEGRNERGHVVSEHKGEEGERGKGEGESGGWVEEYNQSAAAF